MTPEIVFFAAVTAPMTALEYAGIAQALIQFGSMGVLSGVLFYIWHTARKDNMEMMKTQRADHVQELKNNRQSHIEAINIMVGSFRERDEMRQQSYDALLVENREFRKQTEAGFSKMTEKLAEIRFGHEALRDERYRENAAKNSEALLEEEKRRTKPRGG